MLISFCKHKVNKNTLKHFLGFFRWGSNLIPNWSFKVFKVGIKESCALPSKGYLDKNLSDIFTEY